MVRNIGLINKLRSRTQVKVEKRERLPLFSAGLLGLRKGSIRVLINFVFSVFSLASAHYFGFMAHVPFEMLSIVAVDFLPGFISVFAFYFTMSYTVAKIFAFPIAQFIVMYLHSLTGVTFFLKRRWPKRLSKSSSKMYKDTVRLERVIYGVLLAFGVYVFFDFCYLKLEFSKIGVFFWVFAISILIAFLMKVGFAARSPVEVLGRLRDKKRVAYKRSMVKGLTLSLASALLGLSYYLGYLRFEKVVGEDPVYISSDQFLGTATILMKSGDSFLLLDGGADVETFYYVSDKFSVKLEDVKSSKTEPAAGVSLKW